MPPAKVESGRKYPLVMLIHGGPSGITTSEWPASFGMSRAIIAALSVRGYYVLLPNPRGSYGQGEDFTRANVKDFGGGDLRDDLAGVDAAIKKYPVDPARLGVTGWSYGGFMTMWTVTQTDRFHAAVGRGRHCQLAKLLWPEFDRSMDDPFFSEHPFTTIQRFTRKVLLFASSKA